MQVTFRCLPVLEPILPRPLPAGRGLPGWLKAMALSAPADAFPGTVRTVKRCPPFLDAMASGFLMPLACDVHVADGRFSWDWAALPAGLPRHTPRAPLSFHVGAQLAGTPLHAEDTLAIKFMNPWLIETPPGVSLFVTHPVNRPDLPFRTVSGLVDTDRYADNYVHFPALWSDPDFSGMLPMGTPVAQCLPVAREGLDLAFEGLDAAGVARLAETQRTVVTPEGAYKRQYRAKKKG